MFGNFRSTQHIRLMPVIRIKLWLRAVSLAPHDISDREVDFLRALENGN